MIITNAKYINADHTRVEATIDGKITQEVGNGEGRDPRIMAWIAEGGVPSPYVAPKPTADELRKASFAADADRTTLVDQLKTATPAQIKTYIANNVTDLASAKAMLTKLALAVALIVRE